MKKQKKPKEPTQQVRIKKKIVVEVKKRINTDLNHIGQTIGGYFEALHKKDIQDGLSNTID